jgi:hypothetical protein
MELVVDRSSRRRVDNEMDELTKRKAGSDVCEGVPSLEKVALHRTQIVI